MDPDLPESRVLTNEEFDEFITTPGIDVMDDVIMEPLKCILHHSKREVTVRNLILYPTYLFP